MRAAHCLRTNSQPAGRSVKSCTRQHRLIVHASDRQFNLGDEHFSQDAPSPASRKVHDQIIKAAVYAVGAGTLLLGAGKAHAAVPIPKPSTATYATSTPTQQVKGNSYARASISTLTPKTSFGELGYKAGYKVLQVLSLPVYGKIAALIAAGVPLLIAGAAWYHKASGADWRDSIPKTYYTLMDVPGADVPNEESDSGRMVLTVVHLVSVFTFAIIVGIVSEEITTGVEAIRNGNFRVPEEGHTVVLGWDARRTPLLIQQLLEAKTERGLAAVRGPLVLLLGEGISKEEVDEQLRGDVGAQLGRVIITRQGSALNPSDLERVSAGAARTVILTTPCTEEASRVDADTSVIASLAALHSIAMPANSQQSVIVSLDDPCNAGWEDTPAGRSVSALLSQQGRQITTVSGIRELSDMVAYTAMNPGLSAVFEQVCMQSIGKEFYVRHFPELTGKTFQEVRRCFLSATACGIVDTQTGSSYLNPPDTHVLQPWERIVLLASDAKEAGKQEPIATSELDGVISPSEVTSAHLKRSRPRVLVIMPDGYIQGTIQILKSMSDSCGGNAHIVVFGNDPDSSAEHKALGAAIADARHRGCSVERVHEEWKSINALGDAGVAEMDALVLPPPDVSCSEADADAELVAVTLHLLDYANRDPLVRERATPLRLVSGVGTARTRTVLEGLCRAGSPAGSTPKLVTETLLEAQLMSGLLGQVAAEPLLQGVFADLLTPGGAELYTKEVATYNLPANKQISWNVVSEAVRSQNAIALGIVRSSGVAELGPSANSEITLASTDRLVVLADGR